MNKIMITEDYVNFEIAKLLKEKGFDEPVNRFYEISTGQPLLVRSEYCRNSYTTNYAAPTHQMAMKWLREVHNIIITMDYDEYELEKIDKKQVGYGWNIQKIENPTKYLKISEHIFDTYEESCEDAITYCLTNLI